MKRSLGESNEYSSASAKKEKLRTSSQSSDGDVADSFDNDGEFEDDVYDEFEDEYEEDEEDEEEEDEEEDGGDSAADGFDNRPLCKYGAACYRTNPNHLAEFKHPKANVITPTKKMTPKKVTPKKMPKKASAFGASPASYTGPRIVPPEFLAKSKTLGVGWTMFALQKSAGNPNDTKDSTNETTTDTTTTTNTSDTNNNTTNNANDEKTTTPTKSNDKSKTTTPTKDAKNNDNTPTPKSGKKDKKSPAKNKSPAKPSTSSSTDSSVTFQALSDSEIQALFEPYPELKTKYDRSGSVLATKFMKMTAVSGLPLFQSSNPSFNQELVHCINYIFWRVKNEQDKDKKKESIIYLADAYQSCQAVQATAILSTYSKLTNVDMTFLDQVRNLLDDFKGRNLDQLVLTIHPNANLVPDANPAGQAPHIRSAYLLILDRNGVDLPGKPVAVLDHAQPHPPHAEIQKVVSTWPSLFSVDSFISEFVTEINQGANAKFIDHAKFYQWVNKLDDSVAFDKHSVFYNEENKDDYESAQKEEDQLVLPYLSKKVAAEVLCIMGIATK